MSTSFCTTGVWLSILICQGVFYEIDSKNQSCQKKALHCSMHPLDIPDDAKFIASFNLGSPTIEGEGIKLNVWTGSLSGMKGKNNTKTITFYQNQTVVVTFTCLFQASTPCRSPWDVCLSAQYTSPTPQHTCSRWWPLSGTLTQQRY